MSESEKSKKITHAGVPLEGRNYPNEISIANERANKPKIETTEKARLVPVPPKPEKPKGGS